ncbi:MAG: transposase [Acidobacteria bacterium]|nr:transposase [Acidobacteriota bacterium]
MKKRKFDDEEKACILAVLAANKGNSSKTARQTGVLRQTIDKWKKGQGTNAEVAKMLHVKKEELHDLYKLIAVKALGILASKLDDCQADELAVIAGICTDKMLLLE